MKAEKRALIAETRCRSLMGDRDEVTSLAVRVVELEDQCARLNQKLAAANRR